MTHLLLHLSHRMQHWLVLVVLAIQQRTLSLALVLAVMLACYVFGLEASAWRLSAIHLLA